jgi:hypothetical protein
MNAAGIDVKPTSSGSGSSISSAGRVFPEAAPHALFRRVELAGFWGIPEAARWWSSDVDMVRFECVYECYAVGVLKKCVWLSSQGRIGVKAVLPSSCSFHKPKSKANAILTYLPNEQRRNTRLDKSQKKWGSTKFHRNGRA